MTGQIILLVTNKRSSLTDSLASGQISFSVVDGEPYVKVGADSPRPFSGGANTVTISDTVSVGNETKTISIQTPENTTSGTLILVRESYMNVNGSSIIFDETNINSYELLLENTDGIYPYCEYQIYKVSFIKGATIQFSIANNNSATGSTANGKMILLT